MTPEDRFAQQLCRALDQGTRELDSSIAERLRAARERALQRHPIPVESTSIVDAGGTLHLGGDDTRHPFRTLLAILALLIGVSIAYYWNGLDQAAENEEIDSALLADDLPPNAYLDKGFQAWLDKHSPAAD